MQLSESMKKSCGRPIFLEELQAARNFSKVCSCILKKFLILLRQILQTYSETSIFFVCYEKSPPEAVGDDWSQSSREILWWNWWQCHEIHVIVNLSQKYEGNLGY